MERCNDIGYIKIVYAVARKYRFIRLRLLGLLWQKKSI